MSSAWDKALAVIRRHEQPTVLVGELEIRQAEATLGQPLPASYRAFCRELGVVRWPAYIDGPRAIAARWLERAAPAHVIVFGSDGGELQYAFDTRSIFDGEYAIVEIDLEHGYLDEGIAKGPVGGFESWLVDVVADAVADDREQAAADLAQRLDALLRPEVRVPRPWCPSSAEVDAAERALDTSFPSDYRKFSIAFGTVDWPIELVDATGIAELRTTLEAEGDAVPNDFLPFGRDQACVFGFRGKGTSVVVLRDHELETTTRSFLEWLELRVAQRRSATTSDRPGPPPPTLAATDDMPRDVAYRLKFLAGVARQTGRLDVLAAGDDRWGVRVPYEGGTVTKFVSTEDLRVVERLSGLKATK